MNEDRKAMAKDSTPFRGSAYANDNGVAHGR